MSVRSVSEETKQYINIVLATMSQEEWVRFIDKQKTLTALKMNVGAAQGTFKHMLEVLHRLYPESMRLLEERDRRYRERHRTRLNKVKYEAMSTEEKLDSAMMGNPSAIVWLWKERDVFGEENICSDIINGIMVYAVKYFVELGIQTENTYIPGYRWKEIVRDTAVEFYVSEKLASPQWTTHIKRDCEYAYCKERKDFILSSSWAGRRENPPEKVAFLNSLCRDLEEVLPTLTEREQFVIRLRFGFLDGKTRTLEEVGKELGVTAPRARQIEQKALRKLRHPSRSKKLKGYTDWE